MVITVESTREAIAGFICSDKDSHEIAVLSLVPSFGIRLEQLAILRSIPPREQRKFRRVFAVVIS
tara:strand:- start:302 stop:496 length:195 start_codon:yes stop_codon:yes gene_type:complete